MSSYSILKISFMMEGIQFFKVIKKKSRGQALHHPSVVSELFSLIFINRILQGK